jgi:hypothetical protein
MHIFFLIFGHFNINFWKKEYTPWIKVHFDLFTSILNHKKLYNFLEHRMNNNLLINQQKNPITQYKRRQKSSWTTVQLCD